MKRLNTKLFFILILLSVLQVNNVLAQPMPRHGGHDEIRIGREKYRYHNGRFYKPGWFGLFEIIVETPPIGAVVTVLPVGYRIVLVEGIAYYRYGDIYYRACPTGYIVVPDPEVVVTPITSTAVTIKKTSKSEEATTINIPNIDGTFTAVRLTKQKEGYVGPQGEYYEKHPTVKQLKVLYGK